MRARLGYLLGRAVWYFYAAAGLVFGCAYAFVWYCEYWLKKLWGER